MEEWVAMLQGIKDIQEVKIPFQLQRGGQIHDIIESLGGELMAFQYFQKVLQAEPPEIGPHNAKRL